MMHQDNKIVTGICVSRNSDHHIHDSKSHAKNADQSYFLITMTLQSNLCIGSFLLKLNVECKRKTKFGSLAHSTSCAVDCKSTIEQSQVSQRSLIRLFICDSSPRAGYYHVAVICFILKMLSAFFSYKKNRSGYILVLRFTKLC